MERMVESVRLLFLMFLLAATDAILHLVMAGWAVGVCIHLWTVQLLLPEGIKRVGCTSV
jgi:hypothetical protein